MSMRYEGSGIMLNIDRIVRIFFVEHLNMSEIAQTGRTRFFINLDTLARAPWQNFDLSSDKDEERNGWWITVRDRTWSPPKLPAVTIEDADYEISDETQFKQLNEKAFRSSRPKPSELYDTTP